jgi:hypothetical protein
VNFPFPKHKCKIRQPIAAAVLLGDAKASQRDLIIKSSKQKAELLKPPTHAFLLEKLQVTKLSVGQKYGDTCLGD